ncbi:cytochrome P450 [Actinocatenispora rupis]|uniref:cytochrome P450 n=1 Tax=Actinocatenispora rupis TaxID=519421 RepID=UPI0019444F40|nr:cytochrome P450 [Actinocatenispora rupis]
MATTRALPGPRGSALAGNEPAYRRDRIGFLRRCQRQYGDVFRLDATAVAVCDPDLARRVLTDDGEEFRAEGTLLAGARPTAGLVDWPAAGDVVDRGPSAALFTGHAERFTAALPALLGALAGRILPGVSALQRLSAAAVADFCLGRPAGPDPDLADAIGESALALLAVLDSGARLPRWVPDPRRRRLRAADRALSGRLTAAVTARLDAPAPDGPGDLLDQVLAEGAGRGSATRALVTTLAGLHAVPGVALCWLLATVAEHPETYERIRAEAVEGLDRAVAGADPDRLRYTAATVREVLRLYPPTWLLSRQVATSVVLDGWRLRPGEQVLVSPYLIHRDPRRWDDPDTFSPERFLGPGTHGHAYLPFGGVPHRRATGGRTSGGLLGARLAMLQLTLIVAVIARDYELTTRPRPVVPRFSTLLTPTELRLRLTARP